MPQFVVWSLLAMAAGTVLQAAVERAAQTFRADPQPTRSGTIVLWDWAGALAVVLLYGGATALCFTGGDQAAVLLAGRLPDWAVPLAAFAVPFGGAIILHRAAAPLATILFGRPAENPVPKRKNYGAHTPWFAGYRSGAIYKVFITDTILSGARVGGGIDSESVPPKAKEPETWVSTTAATLYDRLDVTAPEFLALDEKNFHFLYRDITEVGYLADKRWLQPRVPHSGRLFLTLASGSKYEFLLLGEFDAAALVRNISEATGRFRVTKSTI